MWYMISVFIEVYVKLSHKDIRWAPFQKKVDAKMLARGHNSSQLLHAFNAHKSTIRNALLIWWFERWAGRCAGYALCASRMNAMLLAGSLKTNILQWKFHTLEYHYILSNLNKKIVKWCKIKHNLHKLKYDHTYCWKVNCMVEKMPKGNKTCVQYVKYLAKNGDKTRTNIPPNWRNARSHSSK